jgi:lipoprotein-releasing system permease protein
MINPVELFVGLRYLRAKRRTRFVSFITLISLLGIALGVAALIVILSRAAQQVAEHVGARLRHGF